MKNIKEFLVQTDGLGQVELLSFNPELESNLITQWVNQDYAEFWGMKGKSEHEVQTFYAALNATDHQHALLGRVNHVPAFLIEVYRPEHDPVSQCYSVEEGDMGMHILLSPPHSPVNGFSEQIMRVVMQFMFDGLGAKRVVVEPDVNNHKIHRLNVKVGFVHQQVIEITYDEGSSAKTALLGFCHAQQFQQSQSVAQSLSRNDQSALAQRKMPALATAQLEPAVWQRANTHLVKKMLCEYSHERLLEPQLVGESTYELQNANGTISYVFNAEEMALNHLKIDRNSIQKRMDNETEPLDAIRFVLEFQQELGLSQTLLATYLEEVSSTLLSACYKLSDSRLTAEQLVHADFQTIETEMNEGHPTFVANNGRIGFNTQDFHQYAPEASTPFQLIWLAAIKDKTAFNAIEQQSYEELIAQELDLSLRLQFDAQLKAKGLSPEDYLLFPVHPWQWFNKLTHLYAADIAQNQLVCMGYGDDYYLAQQSIRTLFNISYPQKYYVKSALSILNMGFMRGLSAKYMAVTPAINQWLYHLITQDEVLAKFGFTPLQEFATLGYEASYYDNDALGDNPYKKMLAALWRDNPVNMIKPDQQLMTMAALLHVDNQDYAVLPAMINASKVSTDDWLRAYFKAYLIPLIHCFYQYKLVFMPHGENLILSFENHVPISAFIKDIGEEICVLNDDVNLPEGVERIAITMPKDMEILSIFTDVFDCIFRYITDILSAQLSYSEQRFWALVAEQIHQYQVEHPQHQALYQEYDLFAPEFALSCLNRLQLGNNKQMVDLANPADSLQFAGHLINPIASFNTQQKVVDFLNAPHFAENTLADDKVAVDRAVTENLA